MLVRAPERETKHEISTDDAIYCAGCGHLVTQTRWAISVGGAERVFINPAGRVFRLQCFKEAPGGGQHGIPTDEHTWFPGYVWDYTLCRGCGTHLGWRFSSPNHPKIFFGLIKLTLTQTPSERQVDT